MSDKDLSEAIKSIIEKELKSFSKLIPKDIISNIEEKISPEIENLIEQSGYIKKSKYKNLERIINDLEDRLSELEKEIAELRSQLEENSVLMERSLELQQQRYLDLDSRILELSSIERNIVSNSAEEDLVMDNGQAEEKLLYKNALELFEASRYAEALEVFSEVIISYPDGIYTPDAYFWSGELIMNNLDSTIF